MDAWKLNETAFKEYLVTKVDPSEKENLRWCYGMIDAFVKTDLDSTEVLQYAQWVVASCGENNAMVCMKPPKTDARQVTVNTTTIIHLKAEAFVIMEIAVLKYDFSVCKLTSFQSIDWNAEYIFLARTDEEYSLVCPTEHVPPNTTDREDGWRAFRIRGVLEFSLVGILAKIATLLAESGISIFAVSTYNTDYVLTKAEVFEKAVELLGKNGYTIC